MTTPAELVTRLRVMLDKDRVEPFDLLTAIGFIEQQGKEKALGDPYIDLRMMTERAKELEAVNIGLRDMLAEKNDLLSLVGAARVKAETALSEAIGHAGKMAEFLERGIARFLQSDDSWQREQAALDAFRQWKGEKL